MIPDSVNQCCLPLQQIQAPEETVEDEVIQLINKKKNPNFHVLPEGTGGQLHSRILSLFL